MEPEVALTLDATLVTLKSATLVTPITAVTVDVLVPVDVDNAPGAMVLVTVPLVELVTTTVMVQVDACGIKVPTGRLKEPVLGAAVAAPALHPVVVTDDGVALINPAG